MPQPVSPWEMLFKPKQEEQPFTPMHPQGVPPMTPMSERQKQVAAMWLAQAQPQPQEENPLEAPMPMGLPMQSASASFSLPSRTPEDIEYERAVKEAIEERRGGIEGMQKQAEALKAKHYGMGQLDISPMVALADAWNGTNMSASYKAPDQRAKDAAVLAKLEEAMRSEKDRVTDDMIKLLGQKSHNANAKMAADAMRQGRFEDSHLLKKEDNIRKDLDKSFERMDEFQHQWGVLQNALASGDSQKINNVLAQYARSISGEKGVLTDKDVIRVMPRNMYNDMAIMMAYFDKTPSGQVPPEYTKKMIEMISSARDVATKVYAEKLEQKRRLYASTQSYRPLMQRGSSGDMMFNVAGERLGSFAQPLSAPGQPTGQPVGQPAAAPQAPQVMSPQDWLKKKRGGQ